MGERAKKIVFLVVVGLASLYLALVSEGEVLQHTAIYQTPGMYIGELLFPAHDWDTYQAMAQPGWRSMRSFGFYSFGGLHEQHNDFGKDIHDIKGPASVEGYSTPF
jgi:hypothetical protein